MKYIPIFILSFMLFSCTDRVPQITGYENSLDICSKSSNCFIASYEFDTIDTKGFMDFVAKTINKERNSEILTQTLNNLHAIYTIPVFGWIDDVNVEVTPSSSGKIILHIRSASREGNWDIGVNKRRVHRIVRKLSYEYKK